MSDIFISHAVTDHKLLLNFLEEAIGVPTSAINCQSYMIGANTQKWAAY